MRALSVSVSSELSSSVCLYFSVVTNVESSIEDAVKVPIDDSAAEKEIACRPFDPQTYNREESLAHHSPGRRSSESTSRCFPEA